MMLIVQLLISLALPVILGISGLLPAGFLGILAGFGIFLGTFLAVAALYLAFFLFVFVGFEKVRPAGLFKHRLLSAYTRWFYNGLLRIRLLVTGRENLPKAGPFVIVSNHIEASDPMFIKQVYRRFPVSFVSKVALFRSFPIKNVLLSVGCIPISPKVDASAKESILESIRRVKTGQPMAIFPEGKRTYSNQIIPFRAGSFKLPMESHADISPVAVYDMHEIARKGRILPVTVRLHVLPVIPYSEYKDMTTVEIAQKVHDLVGAQMDRFAQITGKNGEESSPSRE